HPPWPEDKEFAPRGEQTCLRCHDEAPTNLVLRTPHAQMADPRTPFAAEQCESCHGPSPEHLIKPDEGQERAPVAITFGRDSATPVAQQNQVCLGCHESGLRMNWRGSPHEFADQPCATCHEVHTLKDKVLVKATQPQVCFQCHVTQRAQAFRFSHHPIREGKVVCSDCHNPHGSFGPKQLVKGTLNETCFQCHTEKRGPFLWEHAPVREDCTICHAPHGSTQPRLLKVRAPWLCQQCHLEDRHPSRAYDGTDLPTAPQLLLKGCVNCHSQIHGSNHPSGVRFMR
ncbi:MAG TPA: DmsE family decaheme c-type cytochrome, partial [Kiloniellales bacterium]|nr:DmsE family decaheme c-type cytochrome [Kiloniellales bacterium]